MTDKLHVKIWRGRDQGAFVEYEVPRQDSQTVLDVVSHVQRHLEPSLSYRFACRVGMCGSCAMTVNGQARWTCRTHVAKGSVNMLQNYALEESEVEAGFVLACQAIPTSAELELDYDTG